MNHVHRTPIYRDDDNELLGFVAQDATSWLAQTIFGYTVERTTNREAAEAVLHDRGLGFLMGMWQYFDKDEREWFPCVIKEANEHRVTIIRTSPLGFQDPDSYKQVTLMNPTENTLIKAS